MDRNTLNFLLDGMMGILLLATTFSWRSYYAHLVLGIALVLTVAVHVWLHKRWVVRRVMEVLDRDKKLQGRTRTNLVVDALIGVMFVVSTVSGVTIPLSVATLWSGLHSVSSWAMFLGCILHLALHARWISWSTRRVLTGRPGRSANGA